MTKNNVANILNEPEIRRNKRLVDETIQRLLPDEHSIKEWLDNIKLLSKCSNVAIKLSGFGEFNSAWTESSIRPLIMNSIESFGTDRCMFGSNFPVDKFLSPAKYEDYCLHSS